MVVCDGCCVMCCVDIYAAAAVAPARLTCTPPCSQSIAHSSTYAHVHSLTQVSCACPYRLTCVAQYTTFEEHRPQTRESPRESMVRNYNRIECVEEAKTTNTHARTRSRRSHDAAAIYCCVCKRRTVERRPSTDLSQRNRRLSRRTSLATRYPAGSARDRVVQSRKRAHAPREARRRKRRTHRNCTALFRPDKTRALLLLVLLL